MTNYYDKQRMIGAKPHDAMVDIQMNQEKFNPHLIFILDRIVRPEHHK